MRGFTPTPKNSVYKDENVWQKNAKRKPESHKRKPEVWGFTLVELLLYVALFAVVAGLLVGITTVATRIESREVSSIEVGAQLSFVMHTIERLVRESSAAMVNSDANTSNDTAPYGESYPYLVLRTKDSTGNPSDRDPIVIWKDPATGAIKLQQGTGANESTNDLTTARVQNSLNALSFVKYANYPGGDVVQITLTLNANTENPQSAFGRTLRSAVGRVSAATFDSNLTPGSDNFYDFGAAAQRWQDAFFGGNVTVGGTLGVGTTNPNAKLEVTGGYFQFSQTSSGAPPSADCNSNSQRGRLTLDITNNRLYVCAGASRGWDRLNLIDQ